MNMFGSGGAGLGYPCAQSGSIIGFSFNPLDPYNTMNGVARCGYPLASGFTGALRGTDNVIPKWAEGGTTFAVSALSENNGIFSLGQNDPKAQLHNDTTVNKAFVIRGNNSADGIKKKVLIEDDLKVQSDLSIGGNTYLSGNLYSDGDADFRNLHVRNDLTVSGSSTLTNLKVTGNTELNTLHVAGNTTMSGNLTV